MLCRVWIRIAIATVAACGGPVRSTPANRVEATAGAKTKTASVPPFGDVSIEDGELKLMDHNNGDGRVHVMTVSRDYRGAKLSWADRPGPRTDVNAGTFPIDADERAQIQSW